MQNQFTEAMKFRHPSSELLLDCYFTSNPPNKYPSLHLLGCSSD